MKNHIEVRGDITKMWASGRSEIITVDTDMLDILSRYTWCINGSGRVHARIYSKSVKLHHVITGTPINGLVIDHIDRNPLNNCRNNLRIVTQSENQQNREDSKLITVFGETKTASSWILDDRVNCGDESTIRTRIQLGWSPEDALTKPSKYINRFTYKEDEYILEQASKGRKLKDIAVDLGRDAQTVMRRMRDNIGWDRVDCYEKYCGRCGILKPVSEFYSNKKSRLGYSSYCRECTRKIVKE